MKNFRDLRADEIECRVAMSKDTGLQLLLYKNARTDMDILDQNVGAENWSREHFEIAGTIYCRVGIKTGGEWNYKADCGSENATEPEKSRSSDSFKRACTCWGIGRELYTAPFIWIAAGKYKTGPGGRVTDRFAVSSIEISDKKITALEISNSAGEIVYTMAPAKPKAAKTKTAKPKTEPKPDPQRVCCICGAVVAERMAAASLKKYGAVYCSKDCFDKRRIEL